MTPTHKKKKKWQKPEIFLIATSEVNSTKFIPNFKEWEVTNVPDLPGGTQRVRNPNGTYSFSVQRSQFTS